MVALAQAAFGAVRGSAAAQGFVRGSRLSATPTKVVLGDVVADDRRHAIWKEGWQLIERRRAFDDYVHQDLSDFAPPDWRRR